MHAYALQHLRQSRSQLSQLPCMARGKPSQHFLAFSRHLQNRSALVHAIFRSRKETFSLGSIYKFNRAIVFQPQAFGRVGNGDSPPLGSSRDLQEKLMLLWMQAHFLRSAFAEVQEAAQLEAKLRQGRKKRV